MKLVVDANVIFSAIIKNGKNRKLLLDDKLILYAPLFLKEEVLKYREYLAKKSGMNNKELIEFVDRLLTLANIEFVDMRVLGTYMKVAGRISPDTKDTLYIALALFKGCGLWSNDRALGENQSTIKVITTTALEKLV
jgi:predicted nucleic acid-binding protein